ncbi:hypothetical protein [Nocardioides baculatus]|uniref:Big-1 domain-containing protein n=1 Tax=Nocardioides baculatus TaxID=2801337 RepID=A0ABS1L9Y4_9ACTN|nr:hypothetical protein [Nocardioides baculatus]MBL0748494.1 hypothetical protein [Nocardioides baculatus]
MLFDSCGDYDFTYAAALPAGYTSYWNMDLQLFAPDGNETSGAYVYGSAASGTDSFSLCDSPNLAGTYRVQGTGEACDPDYDCVPITAAPALVTFRLPMTKTTLKAVPKSPAKGQVVRFNVTAKDERPAGYFGTSYASVRLQSRRPGGSWRTISKTSTDDSGSVTLPARYRGQRVAVRAVTRSSSDLTGSVSRTIWIG